VAEHALRVPDRAVFSGAGSATCRHLGVFGRGGADAGSAVAGKGTRAGGMSRADARVPPRSEPGRSAPGPPREGEFTGHRGGDRSTPYSPRPGPRPPTRRAP